MDFSSSTSSARLLEPLCFILFTADIHYFINNPKFLITLPWVNSSQMTCRLMSVALLQLNSYLLVVLWLSPTTYTYGCLQITYLSTFPNLSSSGLAHSQQLKKLDLLLLA